MYRFIQYNLPSPVDLKYKFGWLIGLFYIRYQESNRAVEEMLGCPVHESADSAIVDGIKCVRDNLIKMKNTPDR